MPNQYEKARGRAQIPRFDKHGAFTQLELLVVIAVIGILVSLLLPSLAKSRPHPSLIGCVSNLKQIGVGFRLYANDNNGNYPRFSAKFGNGYVWTNFDVAGNEITSPRVLICPMDAGRPNNAKKSFPTDFSANPDGFANPANQENCLSYFYGTSADPTKPNTLLAGDRNLTANQARHPNGPDVSPMWSYAGKGPTGNDPGIPLGASGLRDGSAPPNCGWNSAMHHFRGNILLGDGSAQEVTTAGLITQLNASDDTNNFCLFPIKSPGEK
jgi:prepilin-type N-terminal cleavage/methylation domain-containing protein